MGAVSLPGQMNVVESRCSMLDHVNLAGGMNTWETNFGEVKGRHSETCVWAGLGQRWERLQKVVRGEYKSVVRADATLSGEIWTLDLLNLREA